MEFSENLSSVCGRGGGGGLELFNVAGRTDGQT